MSRPNETRRAVVVLKSGPGQPARPMVGSRSLHQYWALLMPHFRGILLPPQFRSDDASTQWTWREPVDSSSFTPAELATVRKRLTGAQRSLAASAEDAPGSATADSRRPAAILPQVQARMNEVVAALAAQPDPALAAYVVRSERGLMLHSWGLAGALTPRYPDSAECEIGGTVFVANEPGPGHDVLLETPDGRSLARTRSDASGRFAFSKISPGRYRVRAVSTKVAFPPEGVTVDIEHTSVTGLELRAVGDNQAASAASAERDPAPARRRLLAILLAVALLAIAVSGVAWWWSASSPAPSAQVASRQSSIGANVAPVAFARGQDGKSVPTPASTVVAAAPRPTKTETVAAETSAPPPRPRADSPPEDRAPRPVVPTEVRVEGLPTDPSGLPATVAPPAQAASAPASAANSGAAGNSSSGAGAAAAGNASPSAGSAASTASTSSAASAATATAASSSAAVSGTATAHAPPNRATPPATPPAAPPPTRAGSAPTSTPPAPTPTQSAPTPTPPANTDSAHTDTEIPPPDRPPTDTPKSDAPANPTPPRDTPKSDSPAKEDRPHASTANPDKATPDVSTPPPDEPAHPAEPAAAAAAEESRAEQTRTVVVVHYPRRVRIRVAPWQPRLLQDTILPTAPTRVGEDDALDVLRERLFRERQAQIPLTLKNPATRIGFALELPAEATSPSAPHWRDASGAKPAGGTVTGTHAEFFWTDNSPPSADCMLLAADGRELARVTSEERGSVTLATVAGTRAWPWLGIVRAPADDAGLTATEWTTRLDWKVLSGAPARPTWRRDDRWLGDRGHRLDLILEERGIGPTTHALALVDRVTGWAIVTNVEQTQELAESNDLRAP